MRAAGQKNPTLARDERVFLVVLSIVTVTFICHLRENSLDFVSLCIM